MAPKIVIIGAGPSSLSLGPLLEVKGITDYVIYKRGTENEPPRGRCLDLHLGSGQEVIKEADIFDLFKENSRDGDATIRRLFNQHGEHMFSWGEGRDAPETDRSELERSC